MPIDFRGTCITLSAMKSYFLLI